MYLFKAYQIEGFIEGVEAPFWEEQAEASMAEMFPQEFFLVGELLHVFGETYLVHLPPLARVDMSDSRFPDTFVVTVQEVQP